ncbi:response regulator transcription factor [Kineosporia rhizophila]|uniref:response regulator transcription factor n=1 Tax=Kineosporia TaxID=49184 RepID=UPI000A50123F|nr:response regulator transcription factor [Kineosporia sp. NBRC 101677]MCE0536264.1 response regulator transcription factor [Kineosporia rhizophila]GLY15150.1 DNA-binding response regulator [Kineosporia sp. NBRC 101677]
MRVLVVDDEARFAEGISRGLVAEGFSVDVADNGIDGLWRAREVRYDAILLDVMMPGLNGYAVCQALREEENWTPILMLTAKDGAWDQVEGLDTGADDYVVKPVEFPVLLARLRALVRRGRPERPTILTIGSLVVDPATREVRRGGTPIQLTSREFAVLAFLARSAESVRSKSDILNGVWDDDFEGDPNIVEVYIAHLRSKIDRPFGVETIVTVRGAGYRLTADA